MIDFYFALGLFLVNALIFVVSGLSYIGKSAIFLNYLEEKYPKLYARLGYGAYRYNNLKFILFIFDKKKYKDKTIMSTKKLFKKFLLIWLWNAILMAVSGLYLYIRLMFFA